MRKIIRSHLHLDRFGKKEKRILHLSPADVPPYTLTNTADELNADLGEVHSDVERGYKVLENGSSSAYEENAFQLTSELSLKSKDSYSSSSHQSDTEDFEYFSEDYHLTNETKDSSQDEVLRNTIIGRIIKWPVIFKKCAPRGTSLHSQRSNSTIKNLVFSNLSLTRPVGADTNAGILKRLSLAFSSPIHSSLVANFERIRDSQKKNSDCSQNFAECNRCMTYQKPKKERSISMVLKNRCNSMKCSFVKLENDDQILTLNEINGNPPISSPPFMIQQPNCCKEVNVPVKTVAASVKSNTDYDGVTWRAEHILFLHHKEKARNACLDGLDTLAENSPDDICIDRSRAFNIEIEERDWWIETKSEAAFEKSPMGKPRININKSSANFMITPKIFDCAASSTCHIKSSNTATNHQDFFNIKRHNKICSMEIKTFFNVGLLIWNQSHAEWKKYNRNHMATTLTSCGTELSHDSNHRTPSSHQRTSIRFMSEPSSHKHTRQWNQLDPIKYKELVKGLTSSTKEYQLPVAMNLADLVGLYIEVWKCEQDGYD